MKSHWKLAVLAAVGVFVAAIVITFILADRAEGQLDDQKKSALVQVRRSVRTIVENLSEQQSDRLAKTLELEALSPGTPTELPNTDFLAVGLVQPATTGASWSNSFWESSQARLDTVWLDSQLGKIPVEKVVLGSTIWAKVTGPEQQTYFALLIPLQVKTGGGVENKVAIGILPAQFFSPVNLISKGDDSSVFVVDGAGYALSYPDQQYVGAKIESHPVVAQLMKSPEQETMGQFRIKNDEAILGGYEALSNTNLYVVAAAPTLTKSQARVQSLLHAVLVALGLSIVLALAVGFVSRREGLAKEILLQNLKLMQSGPTERPLEIPVSTQNLSHFAHAVAGYLRAPMTAIVGQSQILSTQVKDTPSREVLDRLTAEVRRVRDFIENLGRTSKLSPANVEVLELNTIISQIITPLRTELAKSQIQFEENLKADLKVRGDYQEVKSALSTIVRFALERLQSVAGERKLTLEVISLGGLAQITVAAKGVELKADVRRQLFVPFQVSVKESNIMGLDLALAHSCILEHNGEVTVEAPALDQFQIHVRLPSAVTARAEATPVQPSPVAAPAVVVTAAPAMTDVSLPRPVPKEMETKLPPPPLKIDKNDLTISKTVTLGSVEKTEELSNVSMETETVTIRRPKVRLDT